MPPNRRPAWVMVYSAKKNLVNKKAQPFRDNGVIEFYVNGELHCHINGNLSMALSDVTSDKVIYDVDTPLIKFNSVSGSSICLQGKTNTKDKNYEIFFYLSALDETVSRVDVIHKTIKSVQQLDEKFIPDTIARVADMVKTVNGVEPDETGDVVIDIPTHSWNTLDGKPFYEDIVYAGTPTSLEFTTNRSDTYPYILMNDPDIPELRPFCDSLPDLWSDDNTYKVVYDEMEYYCKRKQWSSYTHTLGNTSLLAGIYEGEIDSYKKNIVFEDTGEPFCWIFHSYYTFTSRMYVFEAGTHNITFTSIKSIDIKTLDSKFIGDDIARTADVIKTVNGNGPDENGNVAVEIPECKVQTVNGVEPDDSGNIQLPELTEDDALDLLFETGIVEPLADTNGTIYTDVNGNIYTM